MYIGKIVTKQKCCNTDYVHTFTLFVKKRVFCKTAILHSGNTGYDSDSEKNVIREGIRKCLSLVLTDWKLHVNELSNVQN